MPLKSMKMSRKTARHKKKYANKYKFKNKKKQRGTKCVKLFFSHLKELTDYLAVEIVENKLICLTQKNVLRGIRKQ